MRFPSKNWGGALHCFCPWALSAPYSYVNVRCADRWRVVDIKTDRRYQQSESIASRAGPYRFVVAPNSDAVLGRSGDEVAQLVIASATVVRAVELPVVGCVAVSQLHLTLAACTHHAAVKGARNVHCHTYLTSAVGSSSYMRTCK